MGSARPIEANHNLATPSVGRRKALDLTAIALCLAALLYLVSGKISTAGLKTIVAQPLTPLAGHNAPSLTGDGFAKDAVPGMPRPQYLKGSLDLYGSFLQNGDTTGTVTSAPYRAVPDFYLFMSGFPNRPGNRLLIEVATSDGLTVTLQVAPFEDTGRKWLLKRISLRAIPHATSFRVFARDANTGQEGWLGFSLPFEDVQSQGRSGLLIEKQIWFTLLALSAALVALLAPALMLRRLSRFSLVWLPVPGLLGLALLGVAAWLAPMSLHPAPVCRIPLALFFLAALAFFFRVPLSTLVSPTETRLLAVFAVTVAICAAKSMYSLGPVGELFHEEIARTLEIGGRSDSDLAYFVSQLVAKRQPPDSPFARELYQTWSFSDRGQMPALAAVPLVLSGATDLPDHRPEDSWTVFDPQGFAAYRCAMIVFAASTLFFVFGLSELFLPAPWALLASLVTAGAPFFLHDVYYTWPKWEAASFALLAAYLLLNRRALSAGLALGLGYMCHPSALFSLPALLCLLLLQPARPANKLPAPLRILLEGTFVLLGLGAWILFWRLVNGPAYTQAHFLVYLISAGSSTQANGHWLSYRLTSLANTLVPAWQFFFHAADENVNAVEGPSPAIVRFFVQPWSTVPFATGLLYFFCLLRFAYLGARKAPAWLVGVLVLPFLIFAIFMGIDSSGLLKEGLHAWFLSLLIFSVVIWHRYLGPSRAFWTFCGIALFSRFFDVLGMLLLPVILTQHALVRPPFVLSDSLALLVMLAGTFWLCFESWRLTSQLRPVSSG